MTDLLRFERGLGGGGSSDPGPRRRLRRPRLVEHVISHLFISRRWGLPTFNPERRGAGFLSPAPRLSLARGVCTPKEADPDD